MSGIPVSSVVNVSIAIGTTFPARRGFGTLNVVTKESGVISSAERIREYSDMTGVANDWNPNTEAYKAANAYFSQQPKPTSLKISVRFEDAQPATLNGGTIADTPENLAAIVAITDGSFAITIDGAANDIVSMNFSSATSMADVAGVIQAALRVPASGGFADATCVYSNNQFVIASGSSGASSTISFASPVSPANGTDISASLKIDQSGAIKSDGIAGETITQSLNAIEARDDDWYGLAFTKEVRETVQITGEDAVDSAAAWCEARVKVFGNTTNNLDVLNSANSSDIASLMKSKNYRRTMTTYSAQMGEYPSCSIMGRAFTVNFSQPDSTITLKFKQMPGQTVQNLSVNEKAVLDSKNANALVNVGGNDMFAESFMASGVFFDEVHGVDWLTNAIQTNVFGYTLTRDTKVPYTDKGTAALAQQTILALDEARVNGLAAAGETIDGRFLSNGYEVNLIPVADINQSDKEARHYPGLSFTVLGAGAIHSVQINGTFER